ncbi:MAG: zinc-binding dehydrogenase [Thermoleophilia bacterium]
MRAIVLHGPGDLRLDRVPDPRPGPGELVLRVEVALTCATDAKMAAAGRHPALGPLPAGLGHEVVGTVAEAGPGAPFGLGERLVVANSAPCGGCPECGSGRPGLCRRIEYLTGAFAELLRVPARIAAVNAVPLPAGIDPALAAMTEPVACAVHGAARCGAAPGDVVLVLGGGLQGLVVAGLLAARGCRVHLADPHAERRALARRFGAVAVHVAPRDDRSAAALRAALPGGRGAAAVVEAVGRPEAWRAAVGLARPGGEILLHGGCPAGTEVTLPAGPLHYDELTVRGSYHHTPAAVREALALIASEALPLRDLLGAPAGLAEVPRILREERGAKRPVLPE